MVVASERPSVLEAALPGQPPDARLRGSREERAGGRGVRPPAPGGRGGPRRRPHHGGRGGHRGAARPSLEPARRRPATRNKHRMREAFARAGVRSPGFTLLHVTDDPEARPRRVTYPCVLKPTILAGSRGVIRADDRRCVRRRVPADRGDPRRRRTWRRSAKGPTRCWSRTSFPGARSRSRGSWSAGELHVLALFDKPDPLDGPYFEETIYVTPSRLPAETQAAIAAETRWAARALGLTEGPVHAELRVNERGAVGRRDRRAHDRRALLADAPLRRRDHARGAGRAPRPRGRAGLARAGGPVGGRHDDPGPRRRSVPRRPRGEARPGRSSGSRR